MPDIPVLESLALSVDFFAFLGSVALRCTCRQLADCPQLVKQTSRDAWRERRERLALRRQDKDTPISREEWESDSFPIHDVRRDSFMLHGKRKRRSL